MRKTRNDKRMNMKSFGALGHGVSTFMVATKLREHIIALREPNPNLMQKEEVHAPALLEAWEEDLPWNRTTNSPTQLRSTVTGQVASTYVARPKHKHKHKQTASCKYKYNYNYNYKCKCKCKYTYTYKHRYR